MTKLLWPDVLHTPTFDGVDVQVYDATAPLPESAADAEMFVVWGRHSDHLPEDARLLNRVRVVQGLMAGTEVLECAGFGDEVAICSGVGLHDKPVAEHALALVLSLVRRLPALRDAQREHTWVREFAGHQPLHHDGPITTLLDANVLIWGFGSIATTLAPMLEALGAHVRGVARRAGERDGYEVITEASLAETLAETDVLVSILPGGEATRHVIDAERLAQLPPHAYIVNVGRGSVLDEDALLAALQSGRLGGAALDVTEVEPLPADSPLWSEPSLILTPHCAGGRPVGSSELVAANLEALRSGGALRNRV